jgi:hypothetical protein
VLRFDRLVLTPAGLPPRRLPAPHQAEAFGILAVTLVPAPRLVLLSTPFSQTHPRPRSAATAVRLIMTLAHGSGFSQGTARGECVFVLLGRFSKPTNRQSCHLYFRPRTRQPSKRLEKSAINETGSRQGRKHFEKGAAKETTSNTKRPDSPLSPALYKRSQVALFYCSVSPHNSQNPHNCRPRSILGIVGIVGTANVPPDEVGIHYI